MTFTRLTLSCWFLGFISTSTCVPAFSGRSARAVDYAALANKILEETPLVDGWVRNSAMFHSLCLQVLDITKVSGKQIQTLTMYFNTGLFYLQSFSHRPEISGFWSSPVVQAHFKNTSIASRSQYHLKIIILRRNVKINYACTRLRALCDRLFPSLKKIHVDLSLI